MSLPQPRAHEGEAPYSIALVCLGNICRSPMAEVILTSKIAAADLASAVEVHSSGTGDWHVGDPMDRRAAATLSAGGYDPSRHRARTFTQGWHDQHDLILVMDASNHRDVSGLAPEGADPERVQLFRTFDPRADGDLDVPDPWYGGQSGFDDVLAIIERTTDQLVHELRDLL